MRTRGYAAVSTRFSVSANMQRSAYMLLETRKTSNYPYVGFILTPHIVNEKYQHLGGDVYIAAFICPLRNMLPVYPHARATVLVDSVNFSDTHAYIKCIGTLSTGDVGKTVTIEGGHTKWVDLGTYLLAVKQPNTEELYNTLTLDQKRLIKPVFKLISLNDSNGVSMQFIWASVSSGLVLNMIYSKNCITKPTVDMSQTLTRSTSCISFDVSNDKMTMDLLVELPEPDVPMLAVNIKLRYYAPAYRQNTKDTFTITNISLGIMREDAFGSVVEGSMKQPQFTLYDVENGQLPILITTSNSSKVHEFDIQFYIIPQYYADDNTVPDHITKDAGRFLLRVEGTAKFNTIVTSLGLSGTIRPVEIITTTHPITTLPSDILHWSGLAALNVIV